MSPSDSPDHSESISLPFRIFRGPLFYKLVTGHDFFPSKPALVLANFANSLPSKNKKEIKKSPNYLCLAEIRREQKDRFKQR